MGVFRIAIVKRKEETSYLYIEAASRDDAEDKAFERRGEWETLPSSNGVSEVFIDEVKEMK